MNDTKRMVAAIANLLEQNLGNPRRVLYVLRTAESFVGLIPSYMQADALVEALEKAGEKNA